MRSKPCTQKEPGRGGSSNSDSIRGFSGRLIAFATWTRPSSGSPPMTASGRPPRERLQHGFSPSGPLRTLAPLRTKRPSDRRHDWRDCRRLSGRGRDHRYRNRLRGRGAHWDSIAVTPFDACPRDVGHGRRRGFRGHARWLRRRDREDPYSAAELTEKIYELAGCTWDRPTVEAIHSELAALETLDDVNLLTARMNEAGRLPSSVPAGRSRATRRRR